jgi:hypothetical protein
VTWSQPPAIMLFVRTNECKAAAAARIGARRALRERSVLLGALRPCFTRTQTWVQAGKYLSALASELPSRSGWTIAEYCGDRSPDCTQRLLNRVSWDEAAAMSQVRRHAVAGLDQAAARCRRARMTVGALDETGQEKAGTATAGVKRQYMGCAGRVANGINTVDLSYVRERSGHALIGGSGSPPGTSTTRCGLRPRDCLRTCGSVPRGSRPSTCSPMRTPTGCAWISSAGTRSTAAAPNCASTF